MGLLSKIFNTDKLEYILREEEEFTVDAPEEWNVTELIEGDYVTPDMYRPEIVEKYTNGVNGDYWYYVFSKPRRIINVYKDDFYLDGCDNEINSSWLKPEFKVLELSSLRESDEFSVEAPEEWNQRELKVGNIWNAEKGEVWNNVEDYFKTPKDQKDFRNTYEIIHVSSNNLSGKNIYSKKPYIFKIEYFNKQYGPLLNAYIPTDTLNESDEFEVDAPEEWNVTELTVGDTITPDMWAGKFNPQAQSKNLTIDDIWEEKDTFDDGIDQFTSWVDLSGVSYIPLDEVNNEYLKPEYKIVLPDNLNESDEFDVEAPEEWNVELLTVGDFITPDMLKPNNEIYDSQENLYITKIGRYTDGLAAILRNSKGERNLHYLENINNVLKPQYKIFTYLDESEEDDEWTVTSPDEWDEKELTVGSVLTPDMFVDEMMARYWVGNKRYVITKIYNKKYYGVMELRFDAREEGTKRGGYESSVEGLQQALKPEYRVVKPTKSTKLTEQDEFEVDAPQGWNVETLTVGDTITPDMWNKQKFINDDWFGEAGWFGLEDYNETIQDSYLIQSMFFDEGDDEAGADWMVSLNSTTTGKSFGITGTPEELSILNSLLQDNYRIVSPDINESEDEFSVEAPDEWNFTELTVGDTITPDMWQDVVGELLLQFEQGKLFKKIITKPVKIEAVYEGDDIYFIVNGIDPVFTNDMLLPQYKVVEEKDLFESEDEFTVDAPQNWNVELLTVGDFITPNMYAIFSRRLSYNKFQHESSKILRFAEDETGETMVTLEFKDEDYSNKYGNEFKQTSVVLKSLNSTLKPEYKIVEFIDESNDGDFTVDAPKEWNIQTLYDGDLITPDMWNRENLSKIARLKNYIYDPDQDWTVIAEDDPNFIIIKSNGGVKIMFKKDTVNSLLKPEYQLDVPINESDDEFNVKAPAEWDESILKVGSQLKSYMFKDNRPWLDIIKTIITKLNWSRNVMEIEEHWPDGRIKRFRKSPHYEEQFLTKDFEFEKNTKLKELLDIDNDWDVEAPKEWNEIELTVGDDIEPHMWDLNNVDLYDYIDDPNENWIIDSIDERMDIQIVTLSGGETWCRVDDLNGVLKPEYKIVRSLTESEDEFNVEAPKEWNVTELTVGDTITPDMWDVSKLATQLKYYFKKPVEISRIGYSEFDDEELELLVNIDLGEYFADFDINHVNDLLKPQYKVVQNKALTEEEDDFAVDAPTGWNYELLTIGDVITPDMWDDDVNNMSSIKEFNKVLKKPFIIKDISRSDLGGNIHYLITLDNDIHIHSSFLKPQYKVVPDLNESKDDFTVNAPKEWNVTELGVGDYLDSSNLKMQNYSKKYEIVEIVKNRWGNLVLLNVYELVEKPIPGTIRTNKQWETYRQSRIEISDLESKMKPGFKIDVSGLLNESLSKLLEVDDEWSVTSPDKWNESQLTIGDQITPDMWDEKAVIDAGVDGFFLNDEIWTISNIVSRWIQLSSDKFGHLDRVNDIQALLKPQYQIVKNMNESDDEFSVEAPEGWNKILLTKGDYITPDMWRKIPNRFANPPQSVEIGGFGLVGDADDIKTVRLIKSDMSHVAYSFSYDDLNNELLKPQYQIVHPIDGNNKWKDLYEENESDDDFNVDAPKDWNIDYLGIGDTITPDMWNKRETKYVTGLSFNKPLKISWIGTDGISGFIEFEGYKSDYLDVEFIHDLLKPQYRIGLSKLNEEDEDFTVNAPEDWNIQYLGAGDTIKGKMWDWKEIINNVNANHRDDFDAINRDIERWKQVYDEGVTIKSIEGDKDHLWIDFDSNFLNWGPGVRFINRLLSPGYEIEKQLTEEAEDFMVTAPEEWNVQELGIGDKITKDMIKNPEFLNQMVEDFEMDFPGVITKIYKTLGNENWGVRIRFQDVGWRKYLPKSKDIKLGLGFNLDSFNDNNLKPQYKIKEPVFELSTLLENEEDFNVNAPDEWNVELLTVGDIITPDMWGYNGIFFDVSKPLTIEDIGEDEGGWWIQLGRSEAPFDLDEINEYLKSKYRVVPYILEESDDDDFNVSASPEWNVTELGVGDIITPDMWDYTKDGDEFRNKIAKSFIINKIEKDDGWDGGWGVYIIHYVPEFPQASTLTHKLDGLGYGLGELNSHLKPQYKIFIPGALNENEEDFNVSAPESWWEYDGDIEIMFQDTYWYEDENGKEAIVERDGGGILNINDLKQYSYSGWIPFTGNPTSENLNKWYSSIDWDTDLIEIFGFDDSIFEVEEDFDWSTAENVDMDRTGFMIRAISTLKEVEDEFTVKPSKKWDIIYLNKGDFLDNTNSTFTDQNVKYKIGNITSDGEIEVKKYINRGNGFEPQFDRFMKTRKGIVKAKLKPGFDIETSSK